MTSNAVTIYHDYDYGGASQELPVGAYTHATPGLANAISAVKIPAGMVVTLWSNHDFTGEKRILRKDIPRLTDFNDKAQSLLVALDEPGFASSLHFAESGRKISFDKNGFPLDYHSIGGQRMQHFQDMLRLPDANGKQYYMGAFSQTCSDTEGGMVFVGEVDQTGNANIVWCEVLSNRHPAGGYNHPGDLRRLGNVIVIAGQNWNSKADAAKGLVSNVEEVNLWGATKKNFSLVGQIGNELIGKVTNDRVVGKTFDLGTGNFQHVLFYNVSSPDKPKYMGKMNSCVDANNVTQELPGEIDQVNVTKLGEYFYLSFGRGGSGVLCRAKELRPDTLWEFVQRYAVASVPPITFMLNGEVVVGQAQLDKDDSTKVIFEKLSFDLSVRTRVMTSFIPKHPFDDDVTFNLTVLGNGETSVVIADVGSDTTIDIFEVSGAYGPITALYLQFGKIELLTADYVKIPVDLNRDADGDDIYLWYTRDPSKGPPITDIRVDIVDNETSSAPSGYQTIAHTSGPDTPDLNRKAGGDYIYMYYRTDPNAGAPIRNIAILDGKNAQADPGWVVIDKDLNKGAGGAYLCLQFTRS